MERLECDVLVVGAGVIGLAVAAKLAKKKSVVVIDPYPKFGQETSSRNSEVIHSGIYYPIGSKKTEWCIRGRDLLYDYCTSRCVPFANTGKYIVACDASEEAYLEKLLAHCQSLDVPVEKKSRDHIQNDEPAIKVFSGIFLPKTGVVDSHVFMQSLENEIHESGSSVAYRNRFLSALKLGDTWISEIAGEDGNFEVASPILVNAAGLGGAELSNSVLGSTRYEHRYCRGRYFSLSSKFARKFKRLIYPVPPKDGLGVHITVDLEGQARLGPDVEWCADSQYSKVAQHYDCDWDAIRESFVQASRRYCPIIGSADIAPGLIGVRPKLFLDGKATPDFLIENHNNFIHLLGIESPGLTSSLAIADEVDRLT